MTDYLIAINAFFAGILICCAIADKDSGYYTIPAFILCISSAIFGLCR